MSSGTNYKKYQNLFSVKNNASSAESFTQNAISVKGTRPISSLFVTVSVPCCVCSCKSNKTF